MTVVRRGPLDALRARLRPGSERAGATKTKTKTKTPTPKAKAALQQPADTDTVDTFERDRPDPGGGTHGGGREAATCSTKRAGFSASQVFCGAEFAFRVNHVDPLNDGRKDVNLAWLSDGSHGLVEFESALWRARLGKRGQFGRSAPE